MNPSQRASAVTRIIPEPDISSEQNLFRIALIRLEEGRNQGYQARFPPGREEGREVRSPVWAVALTWEIVP